MTRYTKFVGANDEPIHGGSHYVLGGQDGHQDNHREELGLGLNMEWRLEVARTGQVREQLAKLVTTVPEEDKWRMMYLARLLSERGEAYYRSEEEEVIRLSGLVDSLCLN